MLNEQLMNFQECIREVMIQSLLREQPDLETVSVTTADPVKDGDETQDPSEIQLLSPHSEWWHPVVVYE